MCLNTIIVISKKTQSHRIQKASSSIYSIINYRQISYKSDRQCRDESVSDTLVSYFIDCTNQ